MDAYKEQEIVDPEIILSSRVSNSKNSRTQSQFLLQHPNLVALNSVSTGKRMPYQQIVNNASKELACNASSSTKNVANQLNINGLQKLMCVTEHQETLRAKHRELGVRGYRFKHTGVQFKAGENIRKNLKWNMGKGLQKMRNMSTSEENVLSVMGLANLKIRDRDEDEAGDDDDSRVRKEEITLSLQKEKDQFEKMAAELKQQLDNAEKVINVLGQIETEDSLGTLTLESLANYLSDLKRRVSHNHWHFQFTSIAYSLACPLFKRMFQAWDPLHNPSHELELVSVWKNLLHSQKSIAYPRLVSEAILPAARISSISSFDAREPEPMLKFFECWKNLLPSSVLDTILDSAVMPKLSSVVNSWDPRCETDPILVLVESWLPMLGQKRKGLYQMIHIKLGDVLDPWHPSEKTAHTILSPWKNVFDSASWEQLMSRYIVPKLQVTLQEFDINPANQKLDQFNWVMSWASDIPVHLMVDLMLRFFFTKWLQVLYDWLIKTPDFEEIHKWYMGWKEFIPQELLANGSIWARLSIGLDMIAKAADGIKIDPPGYLLNPRNLRELKQKQLEAQQKAARQANQGIPASMFSFP